MIDTATATLEEIRRAGGEALRRELGVVGMVRFHQQFETGAGDYTEERQQVVGTAGVRALAEQIQREENRIAAPRDRPVKDLSATCGAVATVRRPPLTPSRSSPPG